MYRGQATILRANPMMMRAFGGGMLALPVLALVIVLVPEESRKTVSSVLIALFAAGYVALLSRGMQPLREVVELQSDPTGLLANGRPLVSRADIAQAYLRPAIAASAVKGVQVPAWPMTLELVTTSGQLNIDGGDEQRTQHILLALGFPLTIVPANHIADSPQNRRNKKIGWIVAAVLVLAMAGGGAAVAYFESQR